MPAPSPPRTALVTGTSSGLGREFARQLVRERGFKVFATARRLDRLEELRDELGADHLEILDGDLANARFREELWNWAESRSGGIQLLINNAGLGHYAELVEEDFEPIRAMFEVNVLALIDMTQRAGRAMKSRGTGEIIQVSSVLGFLGIPYSTAYVASKFAVNGLVRSLRYELHGSGVRVWAACPGRTESEFRDRALTGRSLSKAPRQGEPTDRVVRAFLNHLGTRRTFVFPGWKARLTVAVAQWLPGPFDWFMSNYPPTYFSQGIRRETSLLCLIRAESDRSSFSNSRPNQNQPLAWS